MRRGLAGFPISGGMVRPLSATDNQAALIREAYRRTEKRIEAQLAVAVAFDQRSYVLAAVAIASASFVLTSTRLTATAGVWTGAALFFTVSAILACISALPLALYTAGSTVAELKDLIDSDHPEISVIYGLAINNDKYIKKNDFKANIRVAIFRFAAILFCVGLAVSVVALVLSDRVA